MFLKNKKFGFTLSEVMITMSLIGVLATLTISTIGTSIQQKARLSEFRAAYAKMDAAFKNITVDEGKVYRCYAAPTAEDVINFGLNVSTRTGLINNAQCQALMTKFAKAMGATKTCETNPIDEGCIPENYPVNTGCFTNYGTTVAYVLDNSMLLFPDKERRGMFLFALDINGRKGPNKWGQDIFPFSLKITEVKKVNGVDYIKSVGILPPTGCDTVAANGKTTLQMMLDSAGYKK